MSEAQLQDAIANACQMLGFWVVHFRAARQGSGHVTPVAYDARGYVDLTIIGHGVVLFRELKVGKGKLSPHQEAWGAHLTANHLDWDVWRDSDWVDGRVVDYLKFCAGDR